MGRLGSENRLIVAGESAASCRRDFAMFGAGRIAPPPVSQCFPDYLPPAGSMLPVQGEESGNREEGCGHRRIREKICSARN